MFEFKKFENRNHKTETRITLTRSYSLGLPAKFYHQNKIDESRYVVLYFDEAKKALGLHFTNDETEKNKFSIIRSKNEGYGGGVAVRSFLKTYDLNPEQYFGKYEWVKENIEGIGELYIIELKARISDSKPLTNEIISVEQDDNDLPNSNGGLTDSSSIIDQGAPNEEKIEGQG